ITGTDTPLAWPGEWEQKTCWEHLTDIAAATGSATYFDTTGRLRFAGPPETSAVPVTAVTTRGSITALSVEDSIDRLRNHVTVVESGGSVKPPKKEPLWSDDGPAKIRAGSSVDIPVEFSDPCLVTDTDIPVTAAPAPGTSWIYADYAKTPKGQGRPVPAHLIDAELTNVTATKATLTIHNHAHKTVWVTKPPTSDMGTGADSDTTAAGIAGHYAKPSTRQHIENDAESVEAFGAFPHEDAEAGWRQSGGRTRARRLLTDLARPSTVITGLTIIGDPRLAIGDVITIRDPDGTRLHGAWAITAITDKHTPTEGYTQDLTVHPAPQPLSEKETP
ncbi:MAG: hypothetical protein ACRD0P_32430, partial [Stackebrandtia sp.]